MMQRDIECILNMTICWNMRMRMCMYWMLDQIGIIVCHIWILNFVGNMGRNIWCLILVCMIEHLEILLNLKIEYSSHFEIVLIAMNECCWRRRVIRICWGSRLNQGCSRWLGLICRCGGQLLHLVRWMVIEWIMMWNWHSIMGVEIQLDKRQSVETEYRKVSSCFNLFFVGKT